MAVKPIPEGYRSLTPYIAVDDAAAAIDFYSRAFGATERMRMPTPDGKVAHAELQIGDSLVMLSDEFEQSEIKAPKTVGGTTCSVFCYVEDVDATFKQAIEAGGTEKQAPEDMFWGDRFARVIDPFGHSWQLATHVEDVTPEQIEERSREAMAAISSS